MKSGEQAHHGVTLHADVDGFPQIHEAAAFGIDGQAAFRCGLHRVAETQVVSQLPGVGLGKAAADVQGVQVRGQHQGIQRAYIHQPGPGPLQGLKVFRVIKLESRVPDNAYGHQLASR